jgi:hypothetical protein
MNAQVRAGSPDHPIWLIAHDDHVGPAWVSRCIESGRLAFGSAEPGLAIFFVKDI